MSEFTIVEFLSGQDLPKKQLWINEALFGYDYIKDYCEALPADARVLEVGSGTGILLSMLSEKYAQCRFEGIEPFGDGFAALTDLNKQVSSLGVEIAIQAYEDFTPAHKYDLIFCVNVFEHLEDWQDFLETSANWLSEEGVCVVLCPNYAFPYESHFKLPIIFNKSLSYKLFHKKIESFESTHSVEGLWKSLNFVKKSEVKAYLKKNKTLELNDRKEILEKMVERLAYDKEFFERQKGISVIAFVLMKLKLIKMFYLFPNFIPYMHLEFKRIKS